MRIFFYTHMRNHQAFNKRIFALRCSNPAVDLSHTRHRDIILDNRFLQ